MKAKGAEVVARRYARALLEVSEAKGDSGLREELDELSALFAGHADLRTALLHPAIPADKKLAVVAALWRKEKPSPLLQRLVALLLERDRVELLPLIAKAYARLWNAARGVVEAEAVSATPMEDGDAHALSAAVGRVLGKQVELRTEVDPGLVGGLLLRMEGRVYDGSVRARLRSLRERLAGDSPESRTQGD
jgi:F-type H+-transporting ATPase subunit delta